MFTKKPKMGFSKADLAATVDRVTEPELVLPACDFVVFGGTGDLALRKLLPGLYQREREHQLPVGTRVIGVSRTPIDDVGYRDLVSQTLFDNIAEDDLEA